MVPFLTATEEGYLPLLQEYHRQRQHPISTYIHGSHAPWKMYAHGPSLILMLALNKLIIYKCRLNIII